MMKFTRSGAAWAACLVVASCVAGSVAGAEPAGGRLDVAGGGLAGDLVPVGPAAGGTRDTFLWRSPKFETPFEFAIGEVSGMIFPKAAPAADAGPFVQLRGGDVVSGRIESLDADALVVETAGPDGPQRLRIARAEVAAIARTADGGSAYVGPVGLADWTQAPPDSWREEAGRIMTDSAGAAVTRDVRAPARARFTIRLSRRGPAEFRIAPAAAARPEDDGYVLQQVAGDVGGMMLVRRAGGRAAIEPLPAPPWRGDTLTVVLFVDQERGRLAVMFPDAEAADDRRPREVTLPPKPPQASGRFRLNLDGGSITLDRLEVTPWRGDQPTLGDAAATTIVTTQGPVEGFTVASFDAAAGAYVLTRGGETKRVPAADVEEIRFPDGGGAEPDHALRVVRADGGTLSGDLVEVDERAVRLRRRGIDTVVAVPRAAIAAIRSLRPEARAVEPEGRVGLLVAGDDRTRGWLATNAAGLAWWPVGSRTAAVFADPLSCEVEYVARRPVRQNVGVEIGGIGGQVVPAGDGSFVVAMLTEDGAAARDGRLQAGDRILAIAPVANRGFVETKGLDQETVMHLLRGRIGTPVRLKVVDAGGADPREIELQRGSIAVAGDALLEQALQVHARLAGAVERPEEGQAAFPALVVLRSGDVSPCRVESIDADGVVLRSPLAGDSDAVRVPAILVKAVELIPTAPTRKLSKTLRDRLLTLPRMQRDRPPTHVLRLLDGDYVRGRLVRADERTITFEILDVVKDFPRKSVARIIWLHPDIPPGPDAEAPAEPAEPEEAAEPAAGARVVQSVAADGRRFTLEVEGVEGDIIHGRSAAFGESAIDVTKSDRLLIGAAVGRDAGSGTFADWVLKPAPEPRALAKPEGQ